MSNEIKVGDKVWVAATVTELMGGGFARASIDLHDGVGRGHRITVPANTLSIDGETHFPVTEPSQEG